MNNIEPVGKVNGIARNRKVGYHHNEENPRDFLEMFKKKVEKAEKTEKEQEEQQVKETEKTVPSEKILIKRNILRYKTSNSHIYKIETEKTKHDRSLAVHLTKPERKVGRMMDAYNKSQKETEKVEKVHENCGVSKKEQKETEKVTVKTKKEEMKEFKQSLEKREKTPLDLACEEFEKVQDANLAKARLMRRVGNIGKDRDYR